LFCVHDLFQFDIIDFPLKTKRDPKVLVCGAGVGIQLTSGGPPNTPVDSRALTWGGLLTAFEAQVHPLMGTTGPPIMPNDDPVAYSQAIADRLAMNQYWSSNTDLELHRLIAQRVIGKWRTTPGAAGVGATLDGFKCLITTTNYDLLLEQAIPTRFSTSHVDAWEYLRDQIFGVSVLGVGQLQTPKELLITRLHGRYFDIGQEHGFCLTEAEYADPATTHGFVRFMLHSARGHSLVFIGTNGTINDPHFIELWKALRDEGNGLGKRTLCCAQRNKCRHDRHLRSFSRHLRGDNSCHCPSDC
jgi:hypothetical protein